MKKLLALAAFFLLAGTALAQFHVPTDTPCGYTTIQTACTGGGGGGSGTVLDAGITTAHGVSATTANPTTHPRFTFTLGAITPTTVNGNTFTTGTYTLTGAASKVFTFSNTLTLEGTDSSTLNVGTGGTLGTNAFTSTAYLPLAGGTLTGALLWTDNTYDIGASGATRPRTGFFGTSVVSPLFTGNLTGNVTGNVSGSSGSATGNAGTATALATARAIYGNNFDGSAALTQIIASTYGGTGNGFAKLSGPTTSEKTFTLPDATTTILTAHDAVTGQPDGDRT